MAKNTINTNFPGQNEPERSLKISIIEGSFATVHIAVSLGAPLVREAGRFIDERSVRERAARFADPRWTHRR